MNPKSTGSEEITVTAHDMVEYFRTKFSAESKFRVYNTNARGLVVTPTFETKLLLASAPAETVHVITAADRDFLKAMKISV
jgi:hypothetical protein